MHPPAFYVPQGPQPRPDGRHVLIVLVVWALCVTGIVFATRLA
jgi:hypothetical protein